MDSLDHLAKHYDPTLVEDVIYKKWEDSGFFNPDSSSDSAPPFTIILPPPNATGQLHTGHAMMLAIQDLMIRYHRMKGDKTLWLPGTDHASIATQNKVEKILAGEGKTRHDLGREAFLKRVDEYVQESQGTIRTQLRKMGSSLDWSRERYTLEESMTNAVREMFVRMYNDELIYRGNRIVNWCPRCISTLSDDEVEHEERQAKLYYVTYRLKDSDESIMVATTRPETLFADVAVAVNPDDSRYKSFIGRAVILPLANREIPVIADSYVDPEFGTGALKITPAHDVNDFSIGQKYDLKVLRVIDDEGKIDLSALQSEPVDHDAIAHYQGMDRFEAREAAGKDLEEMGLLEKVEDHVNSVGLCYRCDSVVEPVISLQWFIDVNKKMPGREESLKEMALRMVESKEVELIPGRFEKQYFHWMENLHDWCISRQIWFGHQIPAYYCEKKSGGCGEIVIATKEPKTCTHCGHEGLVADTDTLDTWFSSGMWTFTTLGWPDTMKEEKGKKVKTGDLVTFHPTSVLETGFDILFFWVARMILMTGYALNEAPFKTVYLHGLVLDKDGKKMSKSREETAINPLDMIRDYGADALRLSLLVGVTPGNNLRLSKEKIEGYRNFVNKLWNISRFILTLPEDVSPEKGKKRAWTLSDAWIVSRLNTTVRDVTTHIEKYEFSQAAEVLRNFTWDELADWYLEIAKVEGNKRVLLLDILEVVLALWHPFTPFVTEEIYSRSHSLFEVDGAGARPEFLMVRSWPVFSEDAIVAEKEEQFDLVRSVIQAIRNARAENKIPPAQKIQAIFYAPYHMDLVRGYEEVIKRLARVNVLTLMEKGERPTSAVFLKVGTMEVYLPLGLMKIEEERARIQGEIEKASAYAETLQAKLSDPGYTEKAPRNVVEQTKQKLAETQSEVVRLKEQLDHLV